MLEMLDTTPHNAAASFGDKENPKKRFVAYYSQEQCQLDEFLTDSVGVFGLETDRSLSLIEFGGNVDTERVLRFIRATYDGKNKIHALTLFFAAAGYEWLHTTLKGYSQSEWQEVILYQKKTSTSFSELCAELETLKAWFRGDIFDIAQEEKITWMSEIGTKETWEITDTIGQVLITPDYSIEQAIENFFGGN